MERDGAAVTSWAVRAIANSAPIVSFGEIIAEVGERDRATHPDQHA